MGIIDKIKNKNIHWHFEILPQASMKALDFLSRESWLKKIKWYLAGGSALALYFGHRQSVDLDFFTPQRDFSVDQLLLKVQNDSWKTESASKGTIHGELFGAKVSFIVNPFFIPKEDYNWHGAIRILAAEDIAVMKIIAISQRGTKRDFIDLYWYVKEKEPLLNIMRRLPPQYPSVAHDYHHILKSLVYFVDAEEDPMPRVFFKADWKNIKRFFAREVSLAS